MQQQEERWRDRVRGALAGYFAKRSYPRQSLALLILFTGAIGFLASVAMLRAGVWNMAIRYPIAVLVAWCALLGLIRVWVELEKRRFDSEAIELRDALREEAPGKPAASLPSDRHSWLDWLDPATNGAGSALDRAGRP